jgi:hypothetical protein
MEIKAVWRRYFMSAQSPKTSPQAAFRYTSHHCDVGCAIRTTEGIRLQIKLLVAASTKNTLASSPSWTHE